jgi:hypothetical protein
MPKNLSQNGLSKVVKLLSKFGVKMAGYCRVLLPATEFAAHGGVLR